MTINHQPCYKTPTKKKQKTFRNPETCGRDTSSSITVYTCTCTCMFGSATSYLAGALGLCAVPHSTSIAALVPHILMIFLFFFGISFPLQYNGAGLPQSLHAGWEDHPQQLPQQFLWETQQLWLPPDLAQPSWPDTCRSEGEQHKSDRRKVGSNFYLLLSHFLCHD